MFGIIQIELDRIIAQGWPKSFAEGYANLYSAFQTSSLHIQESNDNQDYVKLFFIMHLQLQAELEIRESKIRHVAQKNHKHAREIKQFRTWKTNKL
jgi:hypothetical protein